MPPRQPVLQYSSAFDDEVAAVPEDAPPELPDSPEGVLECVLEEAPEAVMEAAQEPQLEAEPARLPTSVVHGPYYYFYQGGSLPAASCVMTFVKSRLLKVLKVKIKYS